MIMYKKIINIKYRINKKSNTIIIIVIKQKISNHNPTCTNITINNILKNQTQTISTQTTKTSTNNFTKHRL